MFEKAIEITKEMYLSRGWIITKEEERTIFAEIPDDGDDGEEEKGLSAVAKFIETTQEIKNQPLSSMIDFTSTEFGCVTIICNSSITTNVKKLEQMSLGKVEIFHNNDLQMNITTHHLQPKFYKLPLDEAKDFKSKYIRRRSSHDKKKIKNFPVMSRSDPVARFFRYQTGDIVKITTSDEDVSYRVVK